MKNHYKTLNVREDATESQIREAHRELTKLHHPDRNNSSSLANERQQAINEAREVLCDADKRARHNRELRAHEARLAEQERRRSAPTYTTPVSRPVATPSGTNWWGVGLLALGVAAAMSNSKDANGRFHGRDGKFRSGRWG